MQGCRRLFSTSRSVLSLSSQFHVYKPFRFLQKLLDHEQTNHPAYKKAEALGHRILPGDAEWQQWRPILNANSIAVAVHMLKERGFVTTEDVDDGTLIPDWVVVHLILNSVRAPPHALSAMLPLVLNYLYQPQFPASLKPGIIILATFHLAKFNAVVPVQLLTSHFLQTSFTPDDTGDVAAEVQFNLMLQAIARNPSHSVKNAKSSVELLRAMHSRGVSLWKETYDELLNDRFIVLELTKRSIHERRFAPRRNLEEYVRLFAGTRPGIADEETYKRVIEEVKNRKDRGFFTKREGKDVEEEQLEAIAFLQCLVARKSASQRTSFTSPSLPSSSNFTAATDTPSSGPTLPSSNDPSSVASSSKTRRPRFEQVGERWIEQFKAALKNTEEFSPDQIVSFWKDGTITRDQLKESADDRFRIRPNLGLYTEFIRALLVRGERSTQNNRQSISHPFQLASQYFYELLSIGYPLDSHAIAVGLEAMTRTGKPNKAVWLLLQYCGKRLDEMGPSQGGVSRSLHPSTGITTVALNDFLVALVRMGRFDVVFWLFKNPWLFHIRASESTPDVGNPSQAIWPDTRALTVLLQSARKAEIVDEQMLLKLPLDHLKLRFQGLLSWIRRSHHPSDGGAFAETSSSEYRDPALDELRTIVGTRDTGLPYQLQSPPGKRFKEVQRVFWDCLLGAAWTRGTSSSPDCKDPSGSIAKGRNSLESLLTLRTSLVPMGNEGEPALDVIRIPSSSSRTLSLADLLEAHAYSPNTANFPKYPGVVLNDDHFRYYIILLGLSATHVFSSLTLKRPEFPPVSQIPLALAWQRHLHIRPSRSTLAVAIALVGEASSIESFAGAPLVDEVRRFRNRNSKIPEAQGLTEGIPPDGEYVRFIRWIEEWVEEIEALDEESRHAQLAEGVPDETEVVRKPKRGLLPNNADLTKWREVIMRMRTMTTPQVFRR